MIHALFLSLALTAAAAPEPKAENLWLVTPLYPGQELLVSRTEEAIHKLLPEGSTDLVGNAALVALLQQRKADLGCATGERTCRNAVDDYLHSLGLAKLVLIKGGQEEPNYAYQVVAMDLVSGESRSASGSGPMLEKALLAALVKVAPLASSLSVVSDTPGADVYVDTEKVGKTPFDGQILPGDRTIKISAVGFQDVTRTLAVGARGAIKVSEKLQLAPSKLSIQVTPKDASVFIDNVGKGDGDQALDITPGSHTVTVKKANFEDHQETVQIEANKTRMVIVTLTPSMESGILGRTSYFSLSFSQSHIYPSKGIYRTDAFAIDNLQNGGNPNIVAGTPNSNQTAMNGINLEYGIQRGYFGLEGVGLAYRTGSGMFNVYTGQSSNNPGNPGYYTINDGPLVQQGTFSMLDLHALQPQAQYVLWRFMFQAQAGLGLRTLWIQTPNFAETTFKHSRGFLNFTPYASAQANIRFYIVDGFYVAGSIGSEYMLTGTFPEWGFTGGIGYAF